MAENGRIDWTSLWKKEDWVAVWIGFIVILAILVGLKVTTPKFKWTTEPEFKSFGKETAVLVEKLIKQAGDAGETALQEQIVVLNGLLAGADRKAIGAAAKKMEEACKDVKNEGLKKKATTVAKDISGQAGNLANKVFSLDNVLSAVYIGVAYLILSVIAMLLMGERVGQFIAGFPFVFLLAWAAQFIAGNYTVLYYGVEYVLWCLFLGLIVSNTIGIPSWLMQAVRTEFYIKTGLVILGTGMLFTEIVQAGAYGIVQAVLVVVAVWYLTFWVAKKLNVDDEFAAILSSAVSICGVSAAIATSGAVQGDPKKLSYTTSIVLICAVPMMILQPLISKAMGIPDVVAGAWLGGTLDTSGSVVAAGALISESAMKTGVIVKMSQNVLIGVAAFILAVVWSFKGKTGPGVEKPTILDIWFRFPKFVLGYLIASVIFSFLLSPNTVAATKGMLGSLRTWWFALAFTSIGLETRFKDLAGLGGGRPAIAFLIGQGFNIFWTLLLAYLIFGGYFFPAPKL
jgi:uncharacterized integral membrane protein (TIGR00698 family)